MKTNESERMGLEGLTITSLFVDAEHEDALVFRTEQGDVLWATDADCCSETWFADVKGVDKLLGHTVFAVFEEELDDPEDGRSRQECDSLYRITILTEEGGCDIYWRNSSNGYYGGSVFVHGGDDVPAWYTTNTPTPSILTEITEDWRA